MHRAALTMLTGLALCGSPLTKSDAAADTNPLPVLQDIENSLRSFQVNCSYQLEHISFASNTLVPLQQEVAIRVGEGERARAEVSGTTFADGKPPRIRPYRRIAAFDGQSFREMDGPDRYIRGSIGRSSLAVFGSGNPRNFTTHFCDKPVSRILFERGANFVGNAEWDGHAVLVYETNLIPSKRNGIRERKYRFAISPALNFAVVKKERLLRFPPDGPWKLEILVEASDHFRDHSGLWLPRHVRWETYGTPVSADIEPLLLQRRIIRCDGWEVNLHFDDSDFRFDFPPGVRVEDEINGRVFRTAGVNDQMLADQVYAATQIKPASTGVRFWAIVGGNVVLLGVVGALVARRRARRRC